MKKNDLRGYESIDDFSWTKSITTLIIAIMLIIGAVWYTVHTWSDCLEENSYFTCARMMNK